MTLITLCAAHHYQLSFWQQQVPTEQMLPAVGFAAPHHAEIMKNSFSSPPNEYNTTREKNLI